MLTNIVELIELLCFYLYGKIKKKLKKYTTACKVDYTYKYRTTETAKIKEEGDITLQHIAIMSIWCRVISPFYLLLFYVCDIYMYKHAVVNF